MRAFFSKFNHFETDTKKIIKDDDDEIKMRGFNFIFLSDLSHSHIIVSSCRFVKQSCKVSSWGKIAIRELVKVREKDNVAVGSVHKCVTTF